MLKRVPSFCSRPGFPKGLRVLLVQHTKQLGDGEQAALEEQLAGASYEVTAAKDAPSASLLLRGDAAFDICLVEATDFFAANDAGVVLRETAEELPVVLLTRNVEPATILKAIKADAMDVMSVPMAPRNVDRLWQHCVRKRMAVTAERAASTAERDRDAHRNAAGGSGPSSAKGGAAGGARVGGQTLIPLHGSGGARGPSWSSLPPPAALATAVAAPVEVPAPDSGAPGSVGARVTRPRTRPSCAAQWPALPGRWAAPAPPGVKHISWGRQPPLAPQPLTPAAGVEAPERPASALSGLPPTVPPPPLPAWCLGPLGDVDMDDTDVLSPFDDFSDDPTASAATLLPPLGPAPAAAGAAAGAPALHHAAQAAMPGMAIAPGSALTADVAGPVGCYTSLQAQLAQLEHVVALEASLAKAGTAGAHGARGDGNASPTGSGASSAAGSATGNGGVAPPACGPLGLKLRKSASLVDLVASALSTAEGGGVTWRIAA